MLSQILDFVNCHSNTLLLLHSLSCTFLRFQRNFLFYFFLYLRYFFYYCISNFILVAILYHSEFSLDDLLPIVVQETANCNIEQPLEISRPDASDSDVIPQSFTTCIDELNLLGETEDEKSFGINSTNDYEFHVNKLNL